jgi:Domain of unknown function (DUF1707)
MRTGVLDPLMHHPQRLRMIATLAELPDGDMLAVSRLQQMMWLPGESHITCLRTLGDAGYVRTELTCAGTTVALTRQGRAALDRYTAMLWHLQQAGRQDHHGLSPGLRAGDADRDTAAAALAEHFAQGRLTLEELSARLDATLTATTHGELSQAAQGLPELMMFSAQVRFPRKLRRRASRRPSQRGGERGCQENRGRGEAGR